jgi:hypothetical protein
MRTVVVGERPPELEALIQRRRQLGQDLYDEVRQWPAQHLGRQAIGVHRVATVTGTPSIPA